MDQIEFYFRHREQISEWAALERRVLNLVKEYVTERDVAKVTSLLSGEVGDAEIDFYLRNRSLIAEWDSVQTEAGRSLHQALLAAARDHGLEPHEGQNGWTAIRARSAELDQLLAEHKIRVELAWMRQHLLSTGIGYTFPRIGLGVSLDQWQSDSRTRLVSQIQPVANELGLRKRKDVSWVNQRSLDPEGQDLRTYADDCITQLQISAETLQPVLLAAVETAL